MFIWQQSARRRKELWWEALNSKLVKLKVALMCSHHHRHMASECSHKKSLLASDRTWSSTTGCRRTNSNNKKKSYGSMLQHWPLKRQQEETTAIWELVAEANRLELLTSARWETVRATRTTGLTGLKVSRANNPWRAGFPCLLPSATINEEKTNKTKQKQTKTEVSLGEIPKSNRVRFSSGFFCFVLFLLRKGWTSWIRCAVCKSPHAAIGACVKTNLI